jgi:hypothetical protein
MSDDTYYVQLKDNIAGFWPHDILPLPTLDIFRGVWISPSVLETDTLAEKVVFESAILFEDAIRLELAIVDGLAFIIVTADLYTPIPVLMEVTNYLTPEQSNYEFELGPVPLTLTLSSDLLIPAEKDDSHSPSTFVPKPEESVAIEISNVTLRGDIKGNINLIFESTVSLPPAFIADTGIVIEAEGFTFHLSEHQPAPQGLDVNFRGIFFERAGLYLPEDLAGRY